MRTTKVTGSRAVNSVSAGLVLLSVLLLAAIGAGVYWGPEQISKYLVYSETEREAQIWQTRVLRLLEQHEATFENADLTAADEVSLRHFVASSNVFRLRLFDGDGNVFWSSHVDAATGGEQAEHSDIGDDVFFKTALVHGALHHETDMREARYVDQFAVDHVGMVYDDSELRSTSEIFIPVVQGGRTIGVVEHYRDITDALNLSKSRLMIAAVVISAALLVMWATAIIALLLYKKHSQALLNRQREQEHAVALLDQQRNREIRLLSELSEWLQSCKSLDELYNMVSSILARMFPECSGSLYVYSNSRDVLEGACNWHGGKLEDEIRPDDCWGLRRGRVYTFGANEMDFNCSHVERGNKDGYVCVPIVAHGDTIGLMHVVSDSFKTDNGVLSELGAEQRKLTLMCAEQISLAIANVRLRDQLHSQSIRDSLTGLFNRRHFTESCRKLITAAKRRGESFGMISLDVDHFKLFNDNHGHDAGDMVLRAVGEVLEREFEGDDTAFRTGGEEFTVLLPELGADETQMRAEQLRKAIESVVVRYGERALPHITISCGVSIFPDHGDMPQALVKAGDRALYEAKALGRNQVCLASTDQQSELADLLDKVDGEDEADIGTGHGIAAE